MLSSGVERPTVFGQAGRSTVPPVWVNPSG
jgi:hypothetical protein